MDMIPIERVPILQVQQYMPHVGGPVEPVFTISPKKERECLLDGPQSGIISLKYLEMVMASHP